MFDLPLELLSSTNALFCGDMMSLQNRLHPAKKKDGFLPSPKHRSPSASAQAAVLKAQAEIASLRHTIKQNKTHKGLNRCVDYRF
jgi:hypothetical protein